MHTPKSNRNGQGLFKDEAGFFNTLNNELNYEIGKPKRKSKPDIIARLNKIKVEIE